MSVTLTQFAARDLWPLRYESDGHQIQRRETNNRITTIREEWDPFLCSTIHVAKLTDGQFKGEYHVWDGGCRLRSRMDDSIEGDLDPEFQFDAVVEPLSVVEVAKKFLGTSKGRKAIPKLDEYGIALTYRADWAVAMRGAFQANRLQAGNSPRLPNGDDGTMAAIGACETAIRRAAKVTSWEEASAHLANVIRLNLLGFPRGEGTASYALDGDLIVAMDALVRRNADEYNEERLIKTLRSHGPAWWKKTSTDLITDRGATPGGEGRKAALDYVICHEYNKKLRSKKLRYPSRVEAALEAGLR